MPIARLRKVEQYARGHLAESIQLETLAALAELSPFHFSRVFKQATGTTPHQFVVRERMLHAQQLTRETARTLIEIALEVGYTSPSYFAQVFRREVGIAPTQFRQALLGKSAPHFCARIRQTPQARACLIADGLAEPQRLCHKRYHVRHFPPIA